MKSFNKLSRVEMKNVLGGDCSDTEQCLGDGGGGAGGVSAGYCIGSTGSWNYVSPATYSQCSADITAYCSSGHGGCTAAG